MTRYFRVDNLSGTFQYVFRDRRTDDGLFLERYDPASGTWIEATAQVIPYLYNGEIGATEITWREADALISGQMAS